MTAVSRTPKITISRKITSYVWSMQTQKKKVSDSDNTEYLTTN